MLVEKARKAARGHSKLVLNSKKSMHREIFMLIESSLQNGESWPLKEAEIILRHADPDLKHYPKPYHKALKAFVLNEVTAWSTEDSAKMISEFYDRWPDTYEEYSLRPTVSNRGLRLDRE